MPSYILKVPSQDNTALSFKALFKSFEEIYTQLHSGLRTRRIAFEIVLKAQNISCYFNCDADIADVVATQIYAYLPDAEIIKVADPFEKFKNSKKNIFKISTNRDKYFPIKSLEESEADPLVKFISYLIKLNYQGQIVLQYIFKALPEGASLQISKSAYSGKKKLRDSLLLRPIWNGSDLKYESSILSAKFAKVLYNLQARVVFVASEGDAEINTQQLTDALNSYNSVKNASLKAEKISATLDRELSSETLVVTPSELSLMCHLPNPAELPGMMQVLSRKQPPPSNLPLAESEVSLFGLTTYRGQNIKFGIKRADRRRHLYIVGKSGVGKSKLIELLAAEDIKAGQGLAVIDPHGDLVDNILNIIPAERINDVIIFDPADVNNPPVFNPFANVTRDSKLRVTLDFIEVFKKLFGSDWTPRIEHLLRYTCLALLDSPDSTILSIPRLFTDKQFRHNVVQNIQEEHVRHFWINEFAAWSEKYDSETVTPLLNKIGQFVSTDIIRNVFARSENRFNFREIMDTRKILLVKISKGILGEENAALLGSILITSIYQAAMSRANVPESARTPFNFYVDEFQNFATRTFAEILSESRKYGLMLTVANQYLAQLDSHIRSTLMGNISSFVVFRLGAEDARMLENEFSPAFSARDLINLGMREFCLKMSIDGESSAPFSGRTRQVSYQAESLANKCVENSRKIYNLPPQTNKPEQLTDNNHNFEAPLV